MNESVHIGIIQYSPVHLDCRASLEKACRLTEEAAGKGAQIIVFGESWLPGYPAWLDYCPDVALWNHEPVKELFLRFYKNSILVPGSETEILAQLARKLNVVICMGVNERISQGAGNGTVYNSFIVIDSSGQLVNHHRKLMPTFSEKMIYGQGDAHGLKAVDTKFARIGGLICWEHWMPLPRQTLHNSGEHIHIALWPSVHEMHQIASRHYAFEGRCFVIAAGQLMKAGDLPQELTVPDHISGKPDEYILNGGSCIIAPDGKYVCEPLYNKETIILTIIRPDDVYKERMTLDTSGHYNRPDIFHFQVNNKRIQ